MHNMNTVIFTNIITILGIGYMLRKNYLLILALKPKLSKNILLNEKEKLHYQEHLSIVVFITFVGIMGIFGLVTGNDGAIYNQITTGNLLDSIINTLPYIVIGFISDHFQKEENGIFNYVSTKIKKDIEVTIDGTNI